MKQLLSTIKSREPILYYAAWIHAILFGLFLFLSLVDDTVITGVNAWHKPMKFAASIGIFLMTIGWYLSMTPHSKVKRIVRWGVVISMVVEMVLIALQAARGTRSHFNYETAFDATVFSTMGFMILLNTIMMVLLLGWLIVKRWKSVSLNLQIAMVWGLAISIVGAYVGQLLISNMGHAINAPEDSQGLFFLNWSMSGGDLRVAHFFALHALQTIPLMAYALETKLGPKTAIAVTAILSLIFLSGVYYLLSQATAGIPFISQ